MTSIKGKGLVNTACLGVSAVVMFLFFFAFFPSESTSPHCPPPTASQEAVAKPKHDFAYELVGTGRRMKQLRQKQREDLAGDRSYLAQHKFALANQEPIESAPVNSFEMINNYLATIVYYPTLVSLSHFRRHVYLDVGAREYESSVGSWFLSYYPGALVADHEFEIYAFDPSAASYQTFEANIGPHKPVKEFIQAAAWVTDDGVTFGDAVVQEAYGPADQAKHTGTKVKSVDFSQWLRKNVQKDDFVVMKMDIESSEFEVLAKMIKDGSIQLVDELFLECHGNFWGGLRLDIPRQACVDLLEKVRNEGVYTHEWF